MKSGWSDEWAEDAYRYGVIDDSDHSHRWLQRMLDDAYRVGREDEYYTQAAVAAEDSPLYHEAQSRIASLEKELQAAKTLLKEVSANLSAVEAAAKLRNAEMEMVLLDLQETALEMRERELEHERELALQRARTIKTFKRIR